ncbi:MAG TPA: FAD-dependent oxidoreductase [Candidatus Limnocylindrales bacterium]|nr:FAD-dependent oxidoreductase [Candidatus Limnocylindrales bacterium]
MSEPKVAVTPTPPSRADLVIIGGGIVGCATAFFAARAGLRSVVLERRAALGTLTTPASTGAFRLQFDNAEEVSMVREGVELFDRFVERTGLDGWDLGLRHGGYLFCSLTEATVERSRRLVDRQRAWGLTDVELLSGDEARRRWPWLSPDVRGARYRAGDGWLDVKRLTAGYAVAASNADRIPDAAAGGGATFALRTGVTGIRMDGDRVTGVDTTRGRIDTTRIVVAAGPFTAQVAALAGAEVVLRPTRRQKLVIPDLPAIPPDAPMTIDEETAAHWRPAMRGCLALFTDPDAPPSEPHDPVPIDHDWAFGLLDPRSDHALARVAPLWREAWASGASSVHWYLHAGQYEYTPDRRPYLGAIGPEGLFLNGGYSGHGIMAGAGGSRMVVDLLTGAADADANPFRPDRSFGAREHDIL